MAENSYQRSKTMKNKDTRFRYTEKQIQFITENVAGRSFEELTRLFNRRFRMSKSSTAIKTVCTNRGLRNGFGNAYGNPNYRQKRKYQDIHIRFIEKNFKGRSEADMWVLFNDRFGLSVTRGQFAAIIANYRLRNGLDCRIKPGNVPHNKGKKKWWKGGEETQFKPGHTPANYMTVGSERVTRDGYVEVKISDTLMPVQRRWRGKHLIIWEAFNKRKVPAGHKVTFADCNKRNFHPSNLLLVSNEEHAVMNKKKLRSIHPELTKAGKLAAALIIKIKERKNQAKHREGT